jgi:serine/threonine-protein kinase
MVLPGSSIGRYLVKRKLAEGGMAELYLCTARGPEGFEKEVVIKRIKAFLSSDQTFIDMFMAEARLASRLNHPNVVQIFDFDKHEDAWFIAMEYVYGASLWELRRRCRELGVPLPSTLVAEIGAQVARGLHYAHSLTEKGKPLALVHRDVTPHNVLMSFDGAVKLTDFGIAKAGTSFTAPGMLKGKFAYMSPEQARGEKVDARTDVFALGITLWEMLTGGRLFEGDSDIAVLRAVQESQIAPPSRLNTDVPNDLSEIVLKALARPLEARFQTAQELDRALANFVLKNAGSTENTDIGLYLRQMFRDELEAAEREMAEPSVAATPGTESSASVDEYAVGNTLQVNRHHGEKTQQTATPQPAVVPSGETPKTAQMPGLRASRPLPPLMDEDDGSQQRTDQVAGIGTKPPTVQMPGVRSSKKKLPPVPPPEPVKMPSETVLGISRDDTDSVTKQRSPRGVLPWIVAACLSVGLIGGLGYAVSQSRSEPPSAVEVPAPPSVAVVEVPAAPIAAPAPAPEPSPAPAPAPAEQISELNDGRAAAAKASHVIAAKAEDPAEAPKPAPAHADVARGTLAVEATPWGVLFVNGKKFGDLQGQQRIPLAPGTYALRIEHPKLMKDYKVTIQAGKVSAPIVFHALQP